MCWTGPTEPRGINRLPPSTQTLPPQHPLGGDMSLIHPVQSTVCEPELLGAVDDTLARKSGRHIWGAGMHHDPLRSTQKHPFFAFGHNFVVFSLQVALPFAPNKYWACPILVRMYRKRQTTQRAPGKTGKLERKQTGQATAKQYRTRPELALEMIPDRGQLDAPAQASRHRRQRVCRPIHQASLARQRASD